MFNRTRFDQTKQEKMRKIFERIRSFKATNTIDSKNKQIAELPPVGRFQKDVFLTFIRNNSLLNDVSFDVKHCVPTKLYRKTVKSRN